MRQVDLNARVAASAEIERRCNGVTAKLKGFLGEVGYA